MEDSIQESLALLAEKLLSIQIKNGSLRYCPTMDLLAIITTEEQVEIYRLNGQKVLGVPAKRSLETVGICWKPNGNLLAIAYSDKSVSLIATQGGKLVHQLQCPVSPEIAICSLSWTVSLTDVSSVEERLKSLQKETTLDDIIHRGFLGEISKAKSDLPGDLTSLDVESILPKMSILPAGGREGDVFTSKPSIDALFHSKDPKTNSSDALLIGFTDGSAYLSVHDFFDIGRFEPGQNMGSSTAFSLLKTANHPYISTMGLLLRDSSFKGDELYFAPLDLRIISDHGKQFSHLASKATQMQNVLRYIRECQNQICGEFKTSQTLPHRFIENVEEDLQKEEKCGFVTAAYHLVATGNCSPVMKEWLVDQLAERGQKRWEKAATSGYENTRRLIHENFLPALDRISILANRLKGLSLFQETATAFGLDTVEIDHIFDTIRCLQLLGHTALIASDSELRQSVSFCAWLRQEIEAQATESSPPDEPEKEPSFDYADILSYIQGPLQHSLLYELLEIVREGDEREATSLPTQDHELYDVYKTAIRRAADGSKTKTRLPGMEVLIDRLQGQCASVFSNIASTQQKKIRFGEAISLGKCDVDVLDMRIQLLDDKTACMVYIAVVSPDKTRLRVVGLRLRIQKGVSSLVASEEARISSGVGAKVVDVKFVDDNSMFVLTQHDDAHRLFAVQYTGDEAKEPDLHFGKVGRRTSTNAKDALDLSHDDVRSDLVRCTFPTAIPPFVPAKLEVNGRKGRRVVCVVANDLRQYRVYDIDSPDGGEFEEEEEDGEALEEAMDGDDGDTVMSS